MTYRAQSLIETPCGAEPTAPFVQVEGIEQRTVLPRDLCLRRCLDSLFRSQPVNSIHATHRMFEHIYGVLNKVYLQNFLHEWAVNRETNLMSLLNP